VLQHNGCRLCWFENLISQGADVSRSFLEAPQHIALISHSKVVHDALDNYELLHSILVVSLARTCLPLGM